MPSIRILCVCHFEIRTLHREGSHLWEAYSISRKPGERDQVQRRFVVSSLQPLSAERDSPLHKEAVPHEAALDTTARKLHYLPSSHSLHDMPMTMDEIIEATIERGYIPTTEEISLVLATLSHGEVKWRDRFEMLEQEGYTLRPRLRPGWTPSWFDSGKHPRACEDGERLPVDILLSLVVVVLIGA